LFIRNRKPARISRVTSIIYVNCHLYLMA
jgi:hypothetical protein